MKEWKVWQILLLAIIWPVGIVYCIYSVLRAGSFKNLPRTYQVLCVCVTGMCAVFVLLLVSSIVRPKQPVIQVDGPADAAGVTGQALSLEKEDAKGWQLPSSISVPDGQGLEDRQQNEPQDKGQPPAMQTDPWEPFPTVSDRQSADAQTPQSTQDNDGGNPKDGTDKTAPEDPALDESDAERPEPAQPSEDNPELQLVSLTDPVSRNTEATIQMKGKPDTEYTLSVTYKSGPSKSKGLGAKTSDESGIVEWSWKIGAKTSLDFQPVITVTGDGNTFSTKITVTE